MVLSVDAGFGMLYCIFISLIARLLGYQTTLDHHSSAYLVRRSRLMAALVAAAGKSATHLLKCDWALGKFRRSYSANGQCAVLGVAYAVDAPAMPARLDADPRPIVLGHLSNLTVEKGLDEVLKVALAASRLGLASKLVLAGTPAGRHERALVDAAIQTGHVDYRGPVYGADKEAFFQDLDVFLFPSRYRNELSPLVVWEALLRGIPVIGYEAGCLSQTSAGAGSTILHPDIPFVDAALDQLRAWREAPDALARARRTSRECAESERSTAVAEALSVGTRLLSYHRPPARG